MSASLTSLPYEIIWYIVEGISINDVVNLGRTCKAMRYLETDSTTCLKIMESKSPFSLEISTREAGFKDYASVFRRLSKSREAVASCSPYSVAIIAFGDTFLYCNGVLSYTIDDTVRILHVHESGQHEVVIDIPHLIDEAIFKTQSRIAGTFLLLYYDEGILSCLYKAALPTCGAWLIAFDERRREIVLSCVIDSTEKIFIRHNAEFLYYGIYSEDPQDGSKSWVLRGYDFRSRKWHQNKIYLPELIGYDIGSTVCFEIFDGYFYAVSNQTTYEVEEVDWTSYYHCVRFPLESPSAENLERTKDHDMWRRQHLEGPLDDRWLCLRLERDVISGNIRVVETRKEWLNGCSTGQRTCYITDIVFTNKEADDHLSAMKEQSLSNRSAVGSHFSSLLTTFPTCAHIFADLTQDRLALTLTPYDKPHFSPPRTRLARNVHQQAPEQKSRSLYKTRVKYYNCLSASFFDLINDSNDPDTTRDQCIRLRVSSRQLNPPARDSSGLLKPEGLDPMTGEKMEGLNETFTNLPTGYWPPKQDTSMLSDPGLTELHQIMNPPSHLGNVEGVADDKSLIYCTGGGSQPKAIIIVTFDPGIKLNGLQPWFGLHRDTRLRKHQAAGTTRNKLAPTRLLPSSSNETAAYHDSTERYSQKDRREEDQNCPTTSAISPTPSDAWVRKEGAMYLTIQRGYNFGLRKI